MNRIKVVFFADILIADFDGASRTMFQLINKIPSSEFEFLFICGLGPDHIGNFKCIHVPTLGVPGNKGYRFATPLLQKAELDEQIRLFSPDLVHISTPSLLGNYALKLAKRLDIPVTTIYHTHFISYVEYYFKKFPLFVNFTKQRVREMLKSFYNQCNTVYVPSVSIMQELSDEGVNPGLMKLWERGIDKYLFSPAKRNPKLLKAITGNDNPCILFVSRLVWEKNLQTMIDLYELIEKQNLNYNLVVVGEGAAREAVEKQMPDATFLGHVGHDKLAEIYASADVFFFPSVTETFGNVVLEAMASGLPCIIADGGGSKDFIRDGFNGFRCSPYNALDYLDRIIEIGDQPRLAKQFSENGIDTSKKYVWENLASIYFEDLKFLTLDLDVFVA
jgi:glycosyltransferase involved in cell wall biosynthesis